jgi:hypothetical protein
MSLTSVQRDFFVKSGLTVLGTSTVTSSTGNTAALQVDGGAGVAKNLIVGQQADIYGALTVSGGTRLQVTTATALTVTGQSTLGAVNATVTTVTNLTASGTLNVTGQSTLGAVNATVTTVTNLTASGTLNVTGQSTLGAISGAATTVTTLTASGITNITNNTQSTSTTSGALTVVGGVGIGGNLFVGGSITGSITTASNLAGGATGSIPYQRNPGVTDFIAIGTAGFLLQSNGTTATWVSTGTLVAGNASTASNIAGGAQYQIPYQTGAGSTAFEAGFEYNYTSNTFNVDNAKINGTTNAGSTATGALQVVGGIGVGKDIVVGNNSHILGYEIISGNLTVNGGNLYSTATTFNILPQTATTINIGDLGTAITIGANGSGYTRVRNQFTVTDTTNATSTLTGALQVRGGAGIGRDLVVGGSVDILDLTASTTTVATNALYVAGGVGIGSSLYVTGPAVFNNNVVFSGTSTFVYSTNTVYTDNILNIHAPAGSTGIDHAWTVNDGKDIGFVFHYYDSADKDAFLGINNTSKYLEWFSNGSENLSTGVYTGTTYGIFKTGGIILADTTASSNTTTGALQVAGGVGIGGAVNIGGILDVFNETDASSTATGALQVVGGAGIGKHLFVGQTITAGGSIVASGDVFVNGGDLYTNQTTFNLVNTTATTINFGGAATAITIGASTGYTRVSNQFTVTNTTAATSTNSGALQVYGGAGIGGNLYVGGNIYGTIIGSVTTASSLNTIERITNATHYLTFVDSNNASATAESFYTTSSVTVNPGTGRVDIGGALVIAGNTTATTLTATGISNFTNTTNAVATNDGAVRISGGLSVVKDVYAGGLITAGATQSATTGSTVNGFFFNNTLLASWTSNPITSIATQNLDSFSGTTYRSAKYYCQVTMETTPTKSIHVSEISIMHDGTYAYINEYGILTNSGQLGTFDATYTGGNLTLTWAANTTTSHVIKLTRLSLTT